METKKVDNEKLCDKINKDKLKKSLEEKSKQINKDKIVKK